MKRSNLKGREVLIFFLIVKVKLRLLQTFTSMSAASAIVITLPAEPFFCLLDFGLGKEKDKRRLCSQGELLLAEAVCFLTIKNGGKRVISYRLQENMQLVINRGKRVTETGRNRFNKGGKTCM